MNYGLIICAGKQSRFKSDIPKALVNLNGEILLKRNIKAMKPYCDKIIVVCSIEKQSFFTKDILLDAELKPIASGKGSGDAVWQILKNMEFKSEDRCYIMWGDSLQKQETYSRLNREYNGVSLIPCKKEEKPYVQIKKTGEFCLEVLFSKFNEQITEGYHDLSLFLCNALELKNKLNEFHDKIVNDRGEYSHKHGNEMEFLDVFNDTNIMADIVEFDEFDEFAFNTVEQFEEKAKKFEK